MMYVILSFYMKSKVYYGASQVYYGESSTSCEPIRLLDLNQLCTNDMYIGSYHEPSMRSCEGDDKERLGDLPTRSGNAWPLWGACSPVLDLYIRESREREVIESISH